MKKKYEFIHFTKIEDKPLSSTYICVNNKSREGLGQIRWYARWRQYCYFPTAQAVYSAGCLDDIKHFIGQLVKT